LLNLKDNQPQDENESAEAEAKQSSAKQTASIPVVVVSAGGRRMGLVVDAFVKRQDSIMGDGGVVLILDPAELITMAVQVAS